MSLAGLADRVRDEARALTPAKVALTAASAVFFALGWTAGLVVRVVWVVVAWSWTAGRLGFTDARRGRAP